MRSPGNYLGLADLEPALAAIATALRNNHRPELHVWAIAQLAALLDLPVAVGDPNDPEFTVEVMLEAAHQALQESPASAMERSPSRP